MKKIYIFLKSKHESVLKNTLFSKLLFVAAGVAATGWFLMRVIPKPSRATYPCMQAAAPVMSAFVIYLLSLFGGFAAYKKSKRYISSHRFLPASLCIVAVLICAVAFLFNDVSTLAARAFQKKEVAFVLTPNNPKGDAKGIFSGRVTWTHAPNTANWDEKTGLWFQDEWNNQNNCDDLMKLSLLSLTGKENEKDAWDALFIYFNNNHDKGEAAYRPGEKIAIKINQNNTYSHDDSEELNASPQLVLSLLRSLVNKGGIAQEDIFVVEPSRFLTDYLYNKCVSEFPSVNYIDNEGSSGRIKSTYIDNAIPYSVDNGSLATGLATEIVTADYLINMALLKGHVGQGVTLCGKNWYGATSIHADWRKNAHTNFDQNRDGTPKYLTFVDFMGHKDLGGKTLVYFIDGLYGSEHVAGKPSAKWKMAPFNNNWPNSLFASQDGVAIDAVGVDFLCTEFPNMADADYSDSYLVEAALAGNPLSGTFYDPERDGTRCKSMGVVEHWNNPADKQYSRNLGFDKGIELVYIPVAQ